MNSSFFPWMLFGHLFGDFLSQNHWMATKKKQIDNLPCVVHCTIYTCIVCLFVTLGGYKVTLIQAILVWLSHWILDRYHTLDMWFKLIGTRSWDTYIPRTPEGAIDWKANIDVQTAVGIAFGALVYVVADNTIHLFLMFLIFGFL